MKFKNVRVDTHARKIVIFNVMLNMLGCFGSNDAKFKILCVEAFGKKQELPEITNELVLIVSSSE